MSDEKREQSFGKWLREPQTMIGLSALVLSICGLFISFYEASIIREHQRASVWPNVGVSPSFDLNEIGFHIRNTGIGPAKIQAANLTYKGNVMQDWREFLITSGIMDTTKTYTGLNTFYSLINNSVLPPNSDQQNVLRFEFVEQNETNEALDNKFSEVIDKKNMNITLCYCSVYDQCWITKMLDEDDEKDDFVSEKNRKVASCEDVENSNI